MQAHEVETTPIEGQKPGTSGLRKKTTTFMQTHYLENFVQSIWSGIGGVAGKTLVLGGDESLELVLDLSADAGPTEGLGGYGAQPASYRPRSDNQSHFH